MEKNYNAPLVPTANIAVNKSRIKLYNKGLDTPTYYLQSGQEFQIELFNPTPDVILAKIILNGKTISQGGLVLSPGQRVFLDRYLDVAKKFMFDTYVVSNSSEVRKAIENNGDIKIEFYKEMEFNNYKLITTPTWITNTFGGYYDTTNTNISKSYSINTCVAGSMITTSNSTGVYNITNTPNTNLITYTSSLNGKIETGRVEQGSDSIQEFNTVNKQFAYLPFHTVEYKLLPVSQKVNTVADINVKRYCTNCGHKLGKTDKFCSSCGKKA